MSKKWYIPKDEIRLAAIISVFAFFASLAVIVSAREERAEKLRFEALTPEQQEHIFQLFAKMGYDTSGLAFSHYREIIDYHAD